MTNPHNPTCHLPWCELQRISHDLAEHDKQYTPCEPVTLKFYNRKRRCVLTKLSTDLIYFGNYTDPRFRTELEYQVAIENQLGQYSEYSYIEVFVPDLPGYEFPGEFIVRHYVRFGRVTSLWYDGPIDTDPYIKEQQVAEKPMLDWRRILWQGKRGMELGQFVDKYRLRL